MFHRVMRSFVRRLSFLAVAMTTYIVCHSQITVTATAATTGPTNYSTLKAAFTAVNAGTHKGSITISISGNTTEAGAVILNASVTGLALYTSLQIKPAPSSSPVISLDSAIILEGADKITIDGSNTVGGTTKNLTISNNSLFGPALVLQNGATMNEFKHTTYKGQNVNGAVIEIGPSAATTGNDNNIFIYNIITKGSSSPFIGISNLGSAGKPNSWNSYLYNKISDFSSCGFSDGNFGTTYSHDNALQGNEFFQTVPQAGSVTAIWINNPTGITDMWLASNFIHDLLSTNTSSTITGIHISGAGSILMENNMIALAGNVYSIRGIVQESVPTKLRAYYNSVCIYGTGSGISRSACFEKGTIGPDTLRNNIFVNRRTSSGTGHQYAIVDNVGYNGGLNSNYNSLYSADRIASRNGFDHITLIDWRGNSGNDPQSVNVNPNFVSAIDLHLVPGSNSGLNNLGTPISTVFDDYDNDARSPSTPDLGADEMPDDTPPLITYTPFFWFTCLTGDRNITATIVDETGVPTSGSLVPRIYYKRAASATWMSRPGTITSGNGNSGTWNFPITASDFGTLVVGDLIEYFVIAQDRFIPLNIGSNPAGATAVNVNAVIAPASYFNYSINRTLSGTYTVGTGGDFTTLTEAIYVYNTSCMSGPVVFNLIQANYSTDETFPLTIKANLNASFVNTLTIKTIAATGSNILSDVTSIILDGAKYVTIDGSKSSSPAGNFIAISSTATNTSGTIEFRNNASFNTLRKLEVSGVTNNSGVIFIGNSGSLSGDGNNANKLDSLNIFAGATKPYAGIYNSGNGYENESNTITNCRIFDFDHYGFLDGNGASSGFSSNTLLEKNIFYHNTPASGDVTAIMLYHPFGIRNPHIQKNIIRDLKTNGTTAIITGIHLWVERDSYTSNNMISLSHPTAELRGIVVQTNAGPYTSIMHNSVHIFGSVSGNAPSYAFYKNSTGSGTVSFNNILSNTRLSTGTGKQYAIANVFPGVTVLSHHNDLYSAGNAMNVTGMRAGINYQTLADWRAATGVDTASVSIAPVFVSSSDLHLVVGSNNGIDNKGRLAPINTDIDFDARSPTPDIGADEMIACSQPAITSPNTYTICSGTSPDISLSSNIPGSLFTWTTGTITNVSGAYAGAGTLIDPILTATGPGGNVQYLVTATSPTGCVGAAYPIAVTVNDSTKIITQPVSVQACDSAITSLSVSASGSGLTYQWRFNNVNITASNSNLLPINPVLSAAAGNYDVIVTGACGTKTSTAAVLTVHPKPVADFTPPAGNLCMGSSLVFTNNSNSSPGNMATAHWEFGDAATSNTTTGTVNHTYSSSGPFNVSLDVTSIYGCKSNPVIKTISISPTTSITTQPLSQTGCLGSTITFSVTASGTAVSYQWKKNTANIAGATSNTYTIAAAILGDVAGYSVEVTGACGVVTSGTATFAVIPAAIIAVQPSATSVCTGSTVSLSVLATGSGLSYQWRRSGTNIAGATSSVYTINPVTLTDFGSYDVVVANSCGVTVTSNPAALSTLPSPANFLPRDTSICSYGKLLLQSLQAWSSYTWNTGATTPGLLIEKPGTYWLQVTNNSNCSGRDSIIVAPKECMKGVYIPNAFTPNNDGKNDFFKAQVFGKATSFKLEVFDRGGQLVFQTTDPKLQWDGSIKGSILPTGVFVWICTYQLEGMRKEVQKGTVMMMR